MNFNEEDINFSYIDWVQFEEVCYDLLVKFHFHSMSWRRGGADKGRDIEAMRYVTDTISVPYQEKWFIECKRHTNGLPIEEIIEKISWAEMERADHFLLITSSYLTQQTRDWLLLAEKNKYFKIHEIEEKELKKKLLLFPDIVVKYFANSQTKLVRNMMLQWLYHDILPEPKALYNLHKNINLEQLDYQELAFLWYAYVKGQEMLEDYWEQEGLEPIAYDIMVPFDFLIPHLKAAKNSDYPVIKISEREKFEIRNGLGLMVLDPGDDEFGFSSVHYQLKGGERVQVLLVRENKRLEVRIGVGYKSDIEKMYKEATEY
jgi:hypothetical protein